MAVHNRKRIFWLSAQTKEATFGTAMTTNLSKFVLDSSGFVDPSLSPFDDRDKLTGRIERTDHDLYNRQGPWVMSLSAVRVTPHIAATVMAYAMGVSATDDDVDSLTGVNQHGIAPSDSLVLPTFTLFEQTKSGLVIQYTGCMITEFSLTVQRGTNQLVDLTFSVLAAYRSVGSAPTGGSVVGPSGEKPFNAGVGGFWIGEKLSTATNRLKSLADSDPYVLYPGQGAVGTATGWAFPSSLDIQLADVATNDFSKRMRSLTWNWSNEVDPEELMLWGAGDTIGKAERNDIVQTLECEFDYDDETELERYMAQTQLMAEFRSRTSQVLIAQAADTQPNYAGMVLSWPDIRYAGLTRGETNNRNTLSATYAVVSPTGNAISMRAKIYSGWDAGYIN